MNKNIVTLLIGFLVFNISFAQDMDEYNSFVRNADALYESKNYSKSAEAYESAFESNNGKARTNDRYNAACSYALSGNSKKAFYHLFYLANTPKVKYQNYNHITSDTDLNSLHQDSDWIKLIKIVEANKAEAEKDLDKSLVLELETIMKEDQTYRRQISQIEKKYGRNSDEMNKHWDLISTKDSINLLKVQKILDEKGWLGPKVVGGRGNTTLFLVIQHASIEVQEKYLPMMRDAVKKGNARASSLALLEDRVSLRKGGKQIYGSQIGRDRETGVYFVSPLIDPINVDVRRAKVGLGSIADYISRWNIVWDVEKHILRNKKANEIKK